MSFFKKITKGAGKFLSKAGDVSGKILGKVGKITGTLDQLSGGLLKQAVASNPKGAQLLAGYQGAKVASGLSKGIGSALEKGSTKAGKEAILQAQRKVVQSPELMENLPSDVRGVATGQGFGRFALGGIGG